MRVIRPAPLSLAAAALLVGIAAAPPVRHAGHGAQPAAARSDAPAREPGDRAESSTSTPAEAARRAADLHHQAMEAGNAGQWRRSATLHRRAAALAAADDARGSRCLELAGSMLYAADDLRGARRALTDAAELAAARGEVAVAAEAFLKAGIVARDLKDPAGEVELTRRAYLLAHSPHLTAAERDAILGRIVQR